MMGFGFGGIGMVLFWLVIAVIAVIAIRGLLNLKSRDSVGPKVNDLEEKSASEILDKRYASGEITQSEFKEKKRDLARK
jgi:putative membrane protein